MKTADIEIGAQYQVREWVKSVRRARGPEPGIGFPAYWSRWTVTIVSKFKRRYVVEWVEQQALHQVPDLPMRWEPRTRRTTVTASQVMQKVSE